jgi:Uma2 family endonuclease
MSALPLHEIADPPPVTTAWWETFADPPSMRAEVVGGELVLSPSASRRHQRIVLELAVLLRTACPNDHEVLLDIEWRLDERGIVAQAPRPDVLVVPVADESVVEPPLLIVEVLSDSDRQRLIGRDLSRIDGKIADYQSNGLRWYLEVVPDMTVVLVDLAQNRVIAQAAGDELFTTTVPFPFQFRLSDLGRR